VASLSHETISKPLALMNAAYVLAHKSDLEAVLANSVGLEFFAPPTDQGA
jgi:hypothetical protein